jgi:hypothetical protein
MTSITSFASPPFHPTTKITTTTTELARLGSTDTKLQSLSSSECIWESLCIRYIPDILRESGYLLPFLNSPKNVMSMVVQEYKRLISEQGSVYPLPTDEAYMFFSQERRVEIFVAALANGESVPNDMFEVMEETWDFMTDLERQPYTDMEAAAEEQYEREVIEFQDPNRCDDEVRAILPGIMSSGDRRYSYTSWKLLYGGFAEWASVEEPVDSDWSST